MSGRQSAATELALKAVENGKLNPFQAARVYGIAPSTIYRALAKKGVNVEVAMSKEAIRARVLQRERMLRAARRKA